jgi:hypothetical protein
MSLFNDKVSFDGTEELKVKDTLKVPTYKALTLLR